MAKLTTRIACPGCGSPYFGSYSSPDAPGGYHLVRYCRGNGYPNAQGCGAEWNYVDDKKVDEVEYSSKEEAEKLRPLIEQLLKSVDSKV